MKGKMRIGKKCKRCDQDEKKRRIRDEKKGMTNGKNNIYALILSSYPFKDIMHRFGKYFHGIPERLAH